MLISFYESKSLIYIIVYCIFKVLFYFSSFNFFSSFIPTLYLISFTKIISFILGIFQFKYSKRFPNQNNNNANNIIQNQNDNNIQQNNLENLEQIDRNLNSTFIFLDNKKRKKYICLIICSAILELIFYSSFNKIYDNDSIGNKRAIFYLVDNKFFLLLLGTFFYFYIHEKQYYIHHIVSLLFIFLCQVSIYFINYENNTQNFGLLSYAFFMNIIFALQNYIERELATDNKSSSFLFILGLEGLFELTLIIILNLVLKKYFTVSNYYPEDYSTGSITFKSLLLILCFLLTEYIRMSTIKDYGLFHLCFCEELVYIFFTIYYFSNLELRYVAFHVIIVFLFLVLIEVIELNFWSLNHNTERFMREREFQLLINRNNISQASTGSGTGSHSSGTGGSGPRIVNDGKNDIYFIIKGDGKDLSDDGNNIITDGQNDGENGLLDNLDTDEI